MPTGNDSRLTCHPIKSWCSLALALDRKHPTRQGSFAGHTAPLLELWVLSTQTESSPRRFVWQLHSWSTPFIKYTHTSFYCAWLCGVSQILHFLQIEGLWQPSIKQIYQHHFFQWHLLILCLCKITSYVLVILATFQFFSNFLLLYFYGNLWSVIFIRAQSWLTFFSDKVL